MKMIRLILMAVALMTIQNITAQIFTTVIDETALQFRVKQIDEFFVRFNYETDYKGDKPKDPTNREEHKKNLLTIVNLDKFSNNKHEIDSTLNEFIDYVIDNNLKIHYEDSTWYAEARCSFAYEGRSYDATLALKPEQVKKFIYRWAVTDVQTTLLSQYQQVSKDTISISPAEHGICFMTLPETFNLNKSSVGTAFAKGYKRSHLAVFDYLMSTGKIKMNSITKVVFHFQPQDVSFDVERIEKNKGYNQGWLINNIIFRKESNNEE